MKNRIIINTFLAFSFACFLKAWKLSAMEDFNETAVGGVGTMVGVGDCAKDDHELAFFKFGSTT